MDPSSALGAPLLYDQLFLASEEHDMMDTIDDYLLLNYEADQAAFDNYCQDLWSWFENQPPIVAPFFF